MCTCRPCYLLFTAEGARTALPRGARPVPVLRRASSLGAGQWDELEIPVGLAFFFVNSVLGRTVAFYPGPAGATESELPLGAWDRIVDGQPGARLAGPRRRGADRPDAGPGRARAGALPSSCRSTAATSWSALLRTVWRGFDGGQEARALLDAFFADLAAQPAARRPAVP